MAKVITAAAGALLLFNLVLLHAALGDMLERFGVGADFIGLIVMAYVFLNLVVFGLLLFLGSRPGGDRGGY